MKNIYAMATSHFDPVWLWQYEEGFASIRSTIKSALQRIKEYPEFVYSFCSPPVFEWIKKVDYCLFKQIKKAVKQGRWELNEAWWVQADCNVPIGESLVRQGLMGQNYLKENFGIISKSAFNTDSFGHPQSLPQLLKNCGVQNYAIMRPGKNEKDLPDLFKWVGLDGSEILTYRFFNDYPDNAEEVYKKACSNISVTSKTENESIRTEIDKSEDISCVIFGVTDHGGAPTKKMIEFWREHAILSTQSDFFNIARQSINSLVIREEIQVKYFGVFINEPEVKANNRRCEYALLNAEKSILMANSCNDLLQKQSLKQAWRDTLFCQFHDIIGGALIKPAYDDARNMQGRALENAKQILHTNLQRITKDINCDGKLWNVVSFNLNGEDFCGTIEVEVQWAWEFDWYEGGVSLKDENDNIIACQIISEKSVLPGFRSRIIFSAQVPAMGYKTFSVIQQGENKRRDMIRNAHKIENEYFNIDVSDGKISVTDKTTGEIFCNCFALLIGEDKGDTWCFNQVCGYKSKAKKAEFVSCCVIDDGDILKILKVDYKYNNSLFSIYIKIYNIGRYIDVSIKVNFSEKHSVLKLALPKAQNVCAGVPFGKVDRQRNDYEYPFNETIHTERYKIYSSEIFAYCAKNNSIELTLLRSAICGDLRRNNYTLADKDYDYMSMGLQNFSFRIELGANGNGTKQSYLNPPVIVIESLHKVNCIKNNKSAEKSRQYVKLSSSNPYVELAAIKPAENNSGTVVRIFNGDKKNSDFSLNLNFSGKKSKKLRIKDKINPFQVKTYLIKGKKVIKIDFLERKLKF